MSLPSRRPSPFTSLFLIVHFVCYISAIHHLRDEFGECKLNSDGASISNTSDASNINRKSQHIFRELAPALSSRTDLVKHERVPPDHIHEVLFAVEQRNLDVLTEMLHDISDPNSSNYGRHKSRAEIEAISSNPESHDAIIRYLVESGATVTSQSLNGEYITAHAPISLWEDLLKTEFFVFHYTQSRGDTVIALVRAEEYSVPRDLHRHVASVFQTIQMPLSIWGNPVIHGIVDNHSDIHANLVTGYISPEILKYQYEIVDDGTGSNKSTQAAFGSIGAFFSPQDLTSFQNRFNLTVQPVTTFVGGHSNDDVCTFAPELCSESNLDIQNLMGTSQYSPTTHWYTDNNSFANWLLEVANIENPPLVISISYGTDEDKVSKGEFDAFNLQAIKLGLRGVTIIVSSGGEML